MSSILKFTEGVRELELRPETAERLDALATKASRKLRAHLRFVLHVPEMIDRFGPFPHGECVRERTL